MLQITPAQHVALNAVYESSQRNRNAMIFLHQEVMRTSRWQTPDRVVLNTLSDADIAAYCDGNFQVVQPQPKRVLQEKPDGAKLSAEQAKAIENWFKDAFNRLPTRGQLLSTHHRYRGEWSNEMASINDVPVDTLGVALYYGIQQIDHGKEESA